MFLRILKGFGVALAAFIALIILALLFFTLVRGRTPAIAGENSVATTEMIELGGVKQFVVTRGVNRDNPVLLMLHGGPSAPNTPIRTLMSPDLEENFVVVNYDQRNAGRSEQGKLEDMTVEQHVADAVELADVLRERFGKEKVYLLGHSWGAQLGLQVAATAPDRFHALINTGQSLQSDATVICEEYINSNLPSLSDILGEEEAQLYLEEFAAQEAEIRAGWKKGGCGSGLVAPFGGSLYGETQSALSVLQPVMLRAPEYRPLDIVQMVRYLMNEHREKIWDLSEVSGLEPTRLDLPIYFFLGRHDYSSPSVAAVAYLDELDAPQKEVVWFEESAHFAFIEEPEKFAQELVRVKEEVEASEALAFGASAWTR